MLLMIIVATMIAIGGMATFYQEMWGVIPLILGGMMLLKGFKIATPSPKKVWLITLFGRKTGTVVRSWPVLLFDWIPLQPVGYLEFELSRKDHDFQMKKPILCSDGKYVEGLISTSIMADDTNGQTLSDFDDIGRIKGIIDQLDDILTSWVQEIANDKEHGSTWMETQGNTITIILLKRITGEIGTSLGNNEFDDTRGLGIKFTKFQVILRPPDKVIDARNEKAVEEANRVSEMFETETENEQILLRYHLYGGAKTMKECRDEIFDARALKAGSYKKIVNQGGVNVATIPSGTEGSK